MSAEFWLMVAVCGTALLAFFSVLAWLDTRRKEREASYRNEMLRRIAEASDPAPLLAYVRDAERADVARTRTKARVAGLITLAVGAALTIFLHQIAGAPVHLVGLVPLFVGAVLLILSEFIMKPSGRAE
jgi:hypothetical protein